MLVGRGESSLVPPRGSTPSQESRKEQTRQAPGPTPGRDICVSCALEDILEPMTWRVICCGEAATEEALEEERERLRICLDRRGRLRWETKIGAVVIPLPMLCTHLQ